MRIEEQAKRNFNSGYNCAESVLLVVSKELGVSRKDADSFIPRMATGFGGGIARNGDVCGALSGGVIAISLALGRDRSEDSREPSYRAVDRFYNDFVKTFGTCKCRELTGVDLKTQQGKDTYQSQIHNERCNPIVAWATKSAHQVIQEAQ
jgi:C_GCAxxG_C_C family probable redox protein